MRNFDSVQERIDAYKKTGKSITKYDDISIEKLDITKLIGLDYAKSIYDVGWGLLIHNLRYKAESCGVIKKLSLSDRVYACGFVIDRDVNAALNIMDKGCSESLKYQMKGILN